MAVSRKAKIALIVVMPLLFVVIAGGIFLAALTAQSLNEDDQQRLVELMHDTFWEPDQVVAAVTRAQQESPLSFRLYRAALRNCLDKTLTNVKNETEIIEKSCGPMPSPKCQQDLQWQASKIQMSVFPLLVLQDPEHFLDHPVIQAHRQLLPTLRASREMGEQFQGGSGANRTMFIQQNLPTVRLLCS